MALAKLMRGIASLLVENPHYGLRKSREQLSNSTLELSYLSLTRATSDLIHKDKHKLTTCIGYFSFSRRQIIEP